MQSLREHLRGPFTKVEIRFATPGWHTEASIPAVQGWYVIETDAPLEVLSRQALWSKQYTKKKSGAVADVKNYDLQARCTRFHRALSSFWNTRAVYSGFASNLQARAREHTFADPGTGGLALAKYPELHEFSWSFSYRTLESLMPGCPTPGVLLVLGEQVWRSENGWPILCAE